MKVITILLFTSVFVSPWAIASEAQPRMLRKSRDEKKDREVQDHKVFHHSHHALPLMPAPLAPGEDVTFDGRVGKRLKDGSIVGADGIKYLMYHYDDKGNQDKVYGGGRKTGGGGFFGFTILSAHKSGSYRIFLQRPDKGYAYVGDVDKVGRTGFYSSAAVAGKKVKIDALLVRKEDLINTLIVLGTVWEEKRLNNKRDVPGGKNKGPKYEEHGLGGITVKLGMIDAKGVKSFPEKWKPRKTLLDGTYSFVVDIPANAKACFIKVDGKVGYTFVKKDVGGDHKDSDVNANGESDPFTWIKKEFEDHSKIKVKPIWRNTAAGYYIVLDAGLLKTPDPPGGTPPGGTPPGSTPGGTPPGSTPGGTPPAGTTPGTTGETTSSAPLSTGAGPTSAPPTGPSLL